MKQPYIGNTKINKLYKGNELWCNWNSGGSGSSPIVLSSSVSQGGSVVDGDNGIYQITNKVGKYDLIFLYDTNSKIEVGKDYILHYELIESSLSDTSNLTFGTTLNVTHNNDIFKSLLSAEVGTPIDISFHCYQPPNSQANRLIYIQLGNKGVNNEYIKFKCYVKR